MKKKTFKVMDMHCANCAMRIEGLEDTLPGVKGISASYHKGEMVVEFDEAKVKEEEIAAAVRGLGYTVL